MRDNRIPIPALAGTGLATKTWLPARTSGGGGGSTTLTWPVVQYGNTGERVRTVQYLLQQWGYSVTVDGSFGPGLLSAVKNFQSSHGLVADGYVGNATWPALTINVQQGNTGPEGAGGAKPVARERLCHCGGWQFRSRHLQRGAQLPELERPDGGWRRR